MALFRRGLLLGLAVFFLVFPAVVTAAAKKPMTLAELALYQGADRQQILEEGAKKEGKLTFYTTGILTQSVRPVVDAFQKKYPYIKVEVWRAETGNLLSRVLEEYKSSTRIAGVIEATQGGEIVLEERGLLQPYYSPNLAGTEDEAIRNAPGGGAFSAGHYRSGQSLGFNTKLVAKDQVPKTYQDLLDPKWKGKMAIPGSNTGVGWMGGILVHLGEDFVKKLVEQNIVVHMVSGRAMLDMVINGEYAFSPSVSDAHVATSKRKGAPIDWVPLEPVLTHLAQIMIPKESPTPHAALLFVDFDLSREAGELYKASGYDSPRKDIVTPRAYKRYYGPTSLKQEFQWKELFGKLFLKK